MACNKCAEKCGIIYLIGNSDFKEQKKEQEFTGRMLDELLPRVRR